LIVTTTPFQFKAKDQNLPIDWKSRTHTKKPLNNQLLSGFFIYLILRLYLPIQNLKLTDNQHFKTIKGQIRDIAKQNKHKENKQQKHKIVTNN